MSEFSFYIDIENSAGIRQGDGPITSASGWTYTARMDRAGSFSFTMPASDPKASLVQKKRVARAYAMINGTWTEVGAGIIDSIQTQPGPDGITLLTVAGDDLLRELTYRSVLNLKLYDDNAPVSHATALSAVGAYAPAGWTFTPDGSPPNSTLYGRFNGHTVLAALIKIAEKSENHFYRGAGRTVVFASSFTSSGIRAIRATGDLAPETAAIRDITQQIDTYDLITRIYPRGSGNGDVQLTLRATTRTAPAGYTLNKSENYIEATAAAATYGRIEQQVDFSEIGPIENTTADLQAAANMLFDAALEELRRRSTEMEQATYTITLDQCSALLRPLQSILVDYSDPDSGLTVRGTLNILEATWTVDASGVETTGLVVSNFDRWPPSDAGSIADSIQQAQVYQALPQLNANSYTTAYRVCLDSEEIAEIDFDFGAEVVQLQKVGLKFRLKPMESTVKSVGGLTSGAGTISTGGPNINETSTSGVLITGAGGAGATESGGPTSTGSGGPTSTGSTAGTTGSGGPTATGLDGPTATGSGGPTATGATSGSTGSGGPTATESGGPTATGSGGPTSTGSTAGTTGAVSLTTDSGGPTSTGSGGAGSTGSTGGETGGPEGGDVISSGRHSHGIGIGALTGDGHLVYLIPNGSNSQLQALGATGTVPVNVSGDHTHDVDDHTHDVAAHDHSISAHTHSITSHTHSIGSHTHSITAHTHTINQHTHTLTAHTHSIDSHTHTVTAHTHSISTHTHSIAQHTHSITAHTHTVTAHTHSISAHTHSISTHTHSLSAHTHDLSDHAHDLSDSIAAIYGIFREDPDNTYGINDLEYRINSGAWAALNTAMESSGWYTLDVTDALIDPDTLRPLSENNTIELRANAGVPIAFIQGVGGGLVITPATAPDVADEGKVIIVSGTTQYDGTYRVGLVAGGNYLIFNTDNDGTEETTGTVQLLKTVMIDARLTVRNIIQAVAYV